MIRAVVRAIFTVRALVVSVAIVAGWLGLNLDRSDAAPATCVGTNSETAPAGCERVVSFDPQLVEYVTVVGSACLALAGLTFVLVATHVIGSWRK